jgi:hypothetical protein
VCPAGVVRNDFNTRSGVGVFQGHIIDSPYVGECDEWMRRVFGFSDSWEFDDCFRPTDRAEIRSVATSFNFDLKNWAVTSIDHPVMTESVFTST